MSIAKISYKKANNLSPESFWYNIPNRCPMCHTAIEPRKVIDEYRQDNDSIFIIYFCNSCNRPFIVQHYNVKNNSTEFSASDIINIFPKMYAPKQFETKIEETFPNFCKIYNQALQAENMDLNEIAGIGYRKALEFLVKDYCIINNPKENEKIKKLPLGQVIENYIKSAPKIQKTAKVSVWLGNDETHYVKIYEDKDINDLKKFIDATVSFINYELIFEEAKTIIENKES